VSSYYSTAMQAAADCPQKHARARKDCWLTSVRHSIYMCLSVFVCVCVCVCVCVI
jgi:hypothetical protein